MHTKKDMFYTNKKCQRVTLSCHINVYLSLLSLVFYSQCHYIMSSLCDLLSCECLYICIYLQSLYVQWHSVLYLLSQYVQCHNVTVSYTHCHNMFQYLTVTMSHHGEVALICGVMTFSLMHTSESNPSLFYNLV